MLPFLDMEAGPGPCTYPRRDKATVHHPVQTVVMGGSPHENYWKGFLENKRLVYLTGIMTAGGSGLVGH